MTDLDLRSLLSDAHEFVDSATELLASNLGDTHPAVIEGRRIRSMLDALPGGAVLVTEETLAKAIHRAWPYRRTSASNLGLSAATLLAALRAGP